MTAESGPTGLGRRRRRLTDQETEQRMLDAAVGMVNETGLTVSLEHISLEEVIREAGVARSAVYRRWPYKDLFFSDLLRELARATAPASVGGRETTDALLAEVAAQRLDGLGSPEGRRAVLLELFRREQDFEIVHRSAEWRTYLALHATFLGLPDGDLRDEVRAALTESERGFTTRIAAGWQQWAELFGYRVRPAVGIGFETLAALVSAHFRGMVLMSPTSPEIASAHIDADPFGTGETAEWPVRSVALAGMALTFLEPDPAVAWDEARIGATRQQLSTLSR
ncbi:MAG TPA: TetR/AcrR family transcriptional regulator [Pseudonocardia sp.]|nr:TetR/AcrR family transcriptional regulator [Pseudonocardia sp.]